MRYTTDESCNECPYLSDSKCMQIDTEMYNMPIWCKYLWDYSWFDYHDIPPEDPNDHDI